MLSRRHPSTSKIQYLLHTQECNIYSAQACRENAAIAQKLVEDIELPAVEKLYTIRGELQDLHMDLGYLAQQLDSSVVRIDRIKRLTIDQMDMFDKRRNRLVGILIAIYVPLAFATVRISDRRVWIQTYFVQSFFDMNISDESIVTYWTNNTVRNDESGSSMLYDASLVNEQLYLNWMDMSNSIGYYGPPNITENSTSLIMSLPSWFLDQHNITMDTLTSDTYWKSTEGNESDLISKGWPSWSMNNNPNATANSTSVTFTQTSLSGSHTWHMRTFWIVAGSLSFGSIVVPVVAGGTIRFIARQSFAHPKFIRSAVSIMWIM